MRIQRYSPLSLSALRVCCWYLLLLYAPVAVSDASVRLQQIILAEDVSAKAGLQDALTGQLTFHPIATDSRTYLGTTDSAFWLRIRLENQENQSVTRWLVISQPRVRHVSLFEHKDGQWQETRGGMAEPFSTRAFPTLSQIFVLDLPPHSTQEVLARVASETVIILEPGLWEPGRFLQQEWKTERVVYFTSGLLALPLLFGLLLTLFAGEPAFLLYGLAALFYTLFIWAVSGLSYRELWPDSPGWALRSIGFSQTMSSVLLLFTHRSLLQIPRYQPRLDRAVRVLIFGFLVLAFLIILSSSFYRVCVLLMMLLGLVLVVGSPVLGFFAWRQGVPLYGYGFAAYALPWQMSHVLYFYSLNIAWLPPLSLSFFFYAVPIALLLSSALILGGLADQLNRVRRDHIQLEQGQREQLEILVKERTIELQQAKTLAEQSLEDQHQFLSMVSHEVRSPLANIKAATQLLELRTQDEDSMNILQRILRGTHRLTQFFDNYLTFDRLNTRQWALCETNIDLPVLLQTLCDHYARIAPHQIHLSLSPTVIKRRWLYADAQLLPVLLDNLLENAIKYSSPGSTIILSAHVDENDDLRLAVSDQGVGIAANELDLVFNKFFRSTQVGRVVGAGLGLHLVRQIADLHGGSIKLKSQAGHGTTAILTLPQQRWVHSNAN